MQPLNDIWAPPVRGDVFLRERLRTHRVMARRLRGDRVHGFQRRRPRQFILVRPGERRCGEHPRERHWPGHRGREER